VLPGLAGECEAGTFTLKEGFMAQPLRGVDMIDAIDELVARSKGCPELHWLLGRWRVFVAFHKFHRAHPEVLDFIVGEIQLRMAKGFFVFSHRSLWEYTRGKLYLEHGPGKGFLMNDHIGVLYSRVIAILHPEFNRHCEFRKAPADEIFGTEIEPMPKKRSKNYARRLQWTDGTPLEQGWRPTHPHVVKLTANRRPDVHPRDDDKE
jgi:hypothetical protein